MRFIGHTMGTPGKTVDESAGIFASIGFDGMEVICQEQTAFAPDITDEQARFVGKAASAKGVPILCLTPYAWDINSADPELAGAEIAKATRAIDLAALLDARFVRAYGGREPRHPEDEKAAFQRAVTALRKLSRHAGEKDVTLLVENHPGTLTRTGTATRRLIDSVGTEALRALYDPANVLHDTDEPWKETFEVQKEIIAYVHCKDYYLDGETRHACPVGEGIVPWRDILKFLVKSGYRGCISFEYEKKWYPEDLPDAEAGMLSSLQFVRKTLEQ